MGILLLVQVADTQDIVEDVKTDIVHGTLQYYCPPNCTLDQILSQASTLYGVSRSRLECLVRRESTNNPNANTNPSYVGYTQFDIPTWQLTPYRIYDRTNGWANIHAAAYLISRGDGDRWPVWRFC